VRRDGDRLLAHLSSAEREVLICAPFIKVGVLSRLLAPIDSKVSVRVVTRWRASEVAVGVSDLEVFDLVAARSSASLQLLDRLHAKIYIADERVLTGSANLTGPVLGWSEKPNLELLTDLPFTDAALQLCLNQLESARDATSDERDKIREQAKSIKVPKLDLASDASPEEPTVLWLPALAAPERLYQAYVPSTRDRLMPSVLAAALSDLEALAIPEELGKSTFKKVVAEAFRSMPAVQLLLDAANRDLSDAEGIELIHKMPLMDSKNAEQLWLNVRAWMMTFLDDLYEIAPAAFVTRLKPGAGRT
jgi:hypothetical protein